MRRILHTIVPHVPVLHPPRPRGAFNAVRTDNSEPEPLPHLHLQGGLRIGLIRTDMGANKTRLAEVPTNTSADTTIHPSEAPLHPEEGLAGAGEARVDTVPSWDADDTERPAEMLANASRDNSSEIALDVAQGNKHMDKSVSTVGARVQTRLERDAAGCQDANTVGDLPEAPLQGCQMFILVHGICGSPGDMTVF